MELVYKRHAEPHGNAGKCNGLLKQRMPETEDTLGAKASKQPALLVSTVASLRVFRVAPLLTQGSFAHSKSLRCSCTFVITPHHSSSLPKSLSLTPAGGPACAATMSFLYWR